MKPTNKLKVLPSKYSSYNPVRSTMYAFEGLYLAFFRELNIRIQFVMGVFLTILGIYFGHYITAMAIFILMAIVISLEMINTAIETLCDLLHPEKSEVIKVIKDMSAGAVLIVAGAWSLVILYLIGLLFGVDLLRGKW